jgi:hypothetical protein
VTQILVALGIKNISSFSSKSRDSAVGIATGYGLDDRGIGVRVPVGATIFTSPYRLDWLWGPPSLLSNSLEVRRPRCEADHSPATSAEVKKMCIYTLNTLVIVRI